MRALCLALVLAGCGSAESAAPAPRPTPTPAPAPGPPPAQAPAEEPPAADVAESSCAFDSLEALCEGFREHHLSSGGWVSEGCGYGARARGEGGFAEVLSVAVRVGHEGVAGRRLVEAPLLEGTVRVPERAEGSTSLVVAARIGARWFPLWSYGEGSGRFTLDARDRVTFTRGDSERHVFAAHAGVPLVAARADVASAPGASEGDWLAVCGFARVVRAVTPTALPDHPDAEAARARARATLARGRWRTVSGAEAFAVRGAPRATIEIYEAQGGACGGGGCTVSARFRTIEGLMPEDGVYYFFADRAPYTACPPMRALTVTAGTSVFFEVAPATVGATHACGFGGFDGTARKSWVIVRYFVGDSETGGQRR